MTKVYLIMDIDPCPDFIARIYDTLEECQEAYLDHILDCGERDEIILIADATKITDLADFSAEAILLRWGIDDVNIYPRYSFHSLREFQGEIGYEIEICECEGLDYEMFELTNIEKLEGKVSITFEPC